ncbi:MAG: hypothetical protein ACI8XZ_005366 [Gammaproteobacteria bacterium]|jgi:hypothetical protein
MRPNTKPHVERAVPFERPATLIATESVYDRYVLLLTFLLCVPVGSVSPVANPLSKCIRQQN